MDKFCENCGRNFHTSDECWDLHPESCDYCGRNYHTSDKCWDLHPELRSSHEQLGDEKSEEENRLSIQPHEEASKLKQKGVPRSKNCGLFIKNLPPGCNIPELLYAIRGFGKVYYSKILPSYDNKPFVNANLVFFGRGPVDRLLQLASEGNFIVRNIAPQVRVTNRGIITHPQANISRVVIVQGPSLIIQQHYLEDFFNKFFKYALETVIFIRRIGVVTRLEFRFASYAHQSAEAYMHIVMAANGLLSHLFTQEEQALWRSVEVSWGFDPCAY